MDIQNDYKELFELFNAHHVDYVVVGTYALAFHGVPRFTGDMDILVNLSPANAVRIVDAPDEFGFGSVGLDDNNFNKPDLAILPGVPPVRIDLLIRLFVVSWEEARTGAIAGTYASAPVLYLGKAS